MFLATRCAFLFRPGRFRFVDSAVDESFGGDAIVVLESAETRMRFTSDRSQLLMTFQPRDGKPNEWFSLGLLRGVLLGDRGGSEVLDDDWAKFLEWSIDELESRFGDVERRETTIAELREQAKRRAKDLFG